MNGILAVVYIRHHHDVFFHLKGDTMIAFYNRDSSSIDNKEAAASSQITVKLG